MGAVTHGVGKCRYGACTVVNKLDAICSDVRQGETGRWTATEFEITTLHTAQIEHHIGCRCIAVSHIEHLRCDRQCRALLDAQTHAVDHRRVIDGGVTDGDRCHCCGVHTFADSEAYAWRVG